MANCGNLTIFRQPDDLLDELSEGIVHRPERHPTAENVSHVSKLRHRSNERFHITVGCRKLRYGHGNPERHESDRKAYPYGTITPKPKPLLNVQKQRQDGTIVRQLLEKHPGSVLSGVWDRSNV